MFVKNSLWRCYQHSVRPTIEEIVALNGFQDSTTNKQNIHLGEFLGMVEHTVDGRNPANRLGVIYTCNSMAYLRWIFI